MTGFEGTPGREASQKMYLARSWGKRLESKRKTFAYTSLCVDSCQPVLLMVQVLPSLTMSLVGSPGLGRALTWEMLSLVRAR